MLSIRVPTSSPDLPLLRTRLALLVSSYVAFVISISLFFQVFARHHFIEHLINGSVPDGVSVKLDNGQPDLFFSVLEYSSTISHGTNSTLDVIVTDSVLFITAQLASVFLSHLVICHLQEIYGFIPLAIARKLRLHSRPASSTFGCQTIGLTLLFVFSAIPLGYFAWLTFTREQSLTVYTADDIELPDSFDRQLLELLGIPLAYRHTDYILLAAIVPWIALLLTVPTMITTAMAWRRRRAKQSLSARPSVEAPHSQLSRGGNVDDKKVETVEIVENV